MPGPDRQALPYRDCVGIAVFNRDGHVFMGRRKVADNPLRSSGQDFFWQLPQGGIDRGEAPQQAALRELYEETNITSVRLLAEAPEWIYYDLPDDLLGISLKGKYRGQRQRWFAFAFNGDDREIDVLRPDNGNSPAEFNGWRWEILSRIPSLIVPFKKDAYEKVATVFADIPPRLGQP